MFTGGADSTLAAISALKNHNEIFLLTFKNRYDLFVSRSCLMAKRLQERFKSHIISHEIVDNNSLFTLLLKRFFRKHFDPSVILLAERGAMYIRAALYCLKNKIQYVYDGSNCDQGRIATPQKLEILEVIKLFFWNYKITFCSPIYDNKILSEKMLFNEGFIRADELYQEKRLFFGKASPVILNIVIGLKNKISNKLHPVFFIETILQLFGTLLLIKNRSQNKWKDVTSQSKKCVEEIINFGKNYIYDLSA